MTIIIDALFVVLAVGYLVFAIRFFRAAVLVLPLFFPLYLLKIQVASIPLTLVEVVIYELTLVFLVKEILWRAFADAKARTQFRERLAGVLRSQLTFAALLFLLAGIIGLFAAKESLVMIDGVTVFWGRKVALGILKGWIIVPLLMFIMIHHVAKKSADILLLLNSYAVSAFILSVAGVWQVITQSYLTSDARVSGPFESANYLALYIAPAVLYCLIRLKECVLPVKGLKEMGLLKLFGHEDRCPLEKPETLIFALAILVMIPVLVFTKSYAALIAFAVAGMFYFGAEYHEYHRSRQGATFPWLFVGMVVAILAAICLLVFMVDPAKWATVLNFESRNSSSVRMEVYTIATTLIREHWLWGIGAGNFPAYYQLEAVRILGHAPYEWNMLHPHNLLLAVWLNMGITGVVAFVWVLVLTVFTSVKQIFNFAFRPVTDRAKLRMIGLSMLLVVLVHGFMDTPYFKNDLSLIYWLIIFVNL